MRADAAFPVFPVPLDALLGDDIHLSAPALHVERLSLLGHDRGVQRLVEVRLRHGDVVLDPAGNRTPRLMNDAEGRVAVFDAGSDDAEGEVVVELANVDVLAPELRPDREHRLDAPV